jgi:hypothetical protein
MFIWILINPFLIDVYMHNPHFEYKGENYWLIYHKMYNNKFYKSTHLQKTYYFTSKNAGVLMIFKEQKTSIITIFKKSYLVFVIPRRRHGKN